MDPLTMLRTATVLLAITAAGGLVLTGFRFSSRGEPPAWLAMVHGLLAGAGLTLLLYLAATGGLTGGAMTALLLFVLAAFGGIVLNLHFHWHHRPMPKGLIVGHALVAVVAFVLLALAAFG